MAVIPHLTDHRPPTVRTVRPLLRRVIARPTAPDVRDCTVLLGQLTLDITQRVRRLIAGHDPALVQPLPRRQPLVELDGGLEEIDHVLVLDVLGPVAGEIEGGEARRVLAELVAPEVRVRCALVDPVRVHPVEQVVAAERLEERPDVRALIGRDKRAVREPGGRVGGRDGIVLPLQVAILCVRPIAEVWP